VPAQSARINPRSRLFRFLVTPPDGLVSNSQAAADELRHLAITPQPLRVLHNAVDRQFLDAGASTEARALRQECPVVVAVGSLIARKRVHWMIRAASELRAQGIDMTLWLLGEGPERERLEQLAADAGLGRRVRFWGERQDVASILRAGDIFLHCAWAEGLPNAVQEAMACGLPVVAPQTAGIPEIVEHGVQGILFPPDDFAGCVDALRRMLREPDSRAALGRAAAARAAEEFDPRRMAAALLAFYDGRIDDFERVSSP
jgi:glycosyltransferase involved in cell wall biosynthesis